MTIYEESAVVENSDQVHVLLIGCGQYARSCYLPWFEHSAATHRVSLQACVDLAAAEPRVRDALTSNRPGATVDFLGIREPSNKDAVYAELDGLVRRCRISAVVVSTPPEDRLVYLQWALDRGLSILSDKPLTSVRNASIDPLAAAQIRRDYLDLAEAYRRARKRNPSLIFDLMVQRRFHPAFDFISDRVSEVSTATGCAVTHFQSTHADGQWRLPSEIVSFDYHGFRAGTGKVSHSGYHMIDLGAKIVSRSMEETGRRVDSIGVTAAPTYPKDHFATMTNETYRRVFGADLGLELTSDELEAQTANYGEVDCVAQLSFYQSERRLTTGTVSLLHNSLSARHWRDSNLPDLYRSNGRLRQEMHYFVQGPFQSIHLASLRGCSKVAASERGATHCEPLVIEVFRNSGVNRRWQPYERVSISELMPELANPDAHLAAARHHCLEHFFGNLRNGYPLRARRSDLLDHDLSNAVHAAVCESMASERTVVTSLPCSDSIGSVPLVEPGENPQLYQLA
jgi:predicted dehydrogenase